MKILSFIIPAYNSEAYLEKCLDSMVVPQLLEQLEIIVVNDGSSDRTADIAREYCDRYPQTVRVIHQENKGHGGALNTGCAAAAGKYLKVIDADDWIMTENLPAFLKYLSAANADVVLTHYRTIDISSGQIKNWRCYPEAFGAAVSMDTAAGHWDAFGRVMTFHGITYRTDFYRRAGMQLSEHVFYEDHEFGTVPCCHAESVLPLDLFIYEYRIGDAAQSVSDANQLKRLSHMQTVLDRLLREYRSRSLSEAGRTFFRHKAQVVLLSYLTTVLLVEPDRSRGRGLAKDIMNCFAEQMPEAYETTRKKYLVFLMMNRLHIRKESWDAFLRSELYRKLRRSHDFN